VVTCDPRRRIPVQSNSCYINFFSYQILYERSLKTVYSVNRQCNPIEGKNNYHEFDFCQQKQFANCSIFDKDF